MLNRISVFTIQSKQNGLGTTLHMKAIDSGGSSDGTLSTNTETIAGVAPNASFEKVDHGHSTG